MFGIVLDTVNSQDYMDNLKRCVKFKATYSSVMRGRKEALEKMSEDVVEAKKIKRVSSSSMIVKSGNKYVVSDSKGNQIGVYDSKSSAKSALSDKKINADKNKYYEKKKKKEAMSSKKIGDIATSLEIVASKVFSGFEGRHMIPYFQSLSQGARHLFRNVNNMRHVNASKQYIPYDKQSVVQNLSVVKSELLSLSRSGQKANIIAAMLSDIDYIQRNMETKELRDGWNR